MLQQEVWPSTVALAPDDLDVLQKFLEAWCEENGVDIADKAAVDVASGLIDWYRSTLSERNLLKPAPGPGPGKVASDSPDLQRLLRELKDA